jgi:hypothetical protein
MTKAAKTCDSFKRVRGRVAKIQDTTGEVIVAPSVFALVARDDVRLESNLLRDESLKSLRAGDCFIIRMTQQKPVRFIEQATLARRALFDAFAPTGGQLSPGQSEKCVRVYQDCARVMESADEVFPCARVNGHFSADGSVHLREQRCWNLYEGNPTQVNSGSESGQIANHAAAQSYDGVRPLQASFREGAKRTFKRGSGFVTLAITHQPMRNLKLFGA